MIPGFCEHPDDDPVNIEQESDRFTRAAAQVELFRRDTNILQASCARLYSYGTDLNTLAMRTSRNESVRFKNSMKVIQLHESQDEHALKEWINDLLSEQ